MDVSSSVADVSSGAIIDVPNVATELCAESSYSAERESIKKLPKHLCKSNGQTSMKWKFPTLSKNQEGSQAQCTANFRRTLLRLRREGYLCDTVVVAEDGQLRAHSIILAAASDFFKAALKAHEKPVEHTILLPDFKKDMLELAITYAYTGDMFASEVDISNEHHAGVWDLLQKLGFDPTVTEKGVDCAKAVDYSQKTVELANDVKVAMGYVDNSDSVKCTSAETIEMTDDGSVKKIDLDSDVKDLQTTVKERGEEAVDVICTTNSRSLPAATARKRSNNRNKSEDNCGGGGGGGGGDDASAEQKSPIKPVTVDAGSVGQVCFICGRRFVSELACRKHVANHGRKPDMVEKRCGVCGLTVASSSNLRQHMMQHTGDRPHLCQHCGGSFIQRKSLQDHIAAHHPDKVESDPVVRKLTCRLCEVTFYGSWKFRQHMRSHRNKRTGGGSNTSSRSNANKPFACKNCGKCFTWKASLVVHESVNCSAPLEAASRPGGEGERKGCRSNLCSDCGKTLSSPYAVEIHRRLHTGEMPFKCPICGWQARRRSALHRHVLVHTDERPFQCVTCGKRFYDRAGLKDHRTIHADGEKQFKCSVCGKTMRRSVHLVVHMRSHSGERPYKCHLCSKAYKQNANLRIHYQRVHQIVLPKHQGRSIKDCSSVSFAENV